MKSRLNLALPFICFLSFSLLGNVNVHAKETLADGIIGMTRQEVNEKFGKPDFLYSEEIPFKRFVVTRPEDEHLQRARFIYDVIINDLYYIERNNKNFEFRFYYGKDTSNGQEIYCTKEYTIKFQDGPLPLGNIVDFIPEFKPAYGKTKVYQERLLNLNNIRLIFVTPEINELSNRIGSLFVDPDKDISDWALSYEVILIDGEPENISRNSMVKEVIVSVDGPYRIGKTAHVFGTKLVENPLQ
ncbi:MAG: hypothetical protein ACUBOA_00910 [Candidatus Loosdrechtia sp.]|uniref:hypothetical protein n=1 Tax=Candidatus Loosdrechtia sp. TaxID=3101272 RepID=UPI003A654B74|nr:MAG: hypothetical protein QY305_07750 [Candidatus Jettenia sp. AMX2]